MPKELAENCAERWPPNRRERAAEQLCISREVLQAALQAALHLQFVSTEFSGTF